MAESGVKREQRTFTVYECPECSHRSYPGEDDMTRVTHDLAFIECVSPLCPAKHPARMVPVTVVPLDAVVEALRDEAEAIKPPVNEPDSRKWANDSSRAHSFHRAADFISERFGGTP